MRNLTSLPANTSRDLETFAKHAGRNIITTDDVMLLARRNEELEDIMRKTLDEIRAKDGRSAVPEKKGRGRPAGKAVGKGKGKK